MFTKNVYLEKRFEICTLYIFQHWTIGLRVLGEEPQGLDKIRIRTQFQDIMAKLNRRNTDRNTYCPVKPGAVTHKFAVSFSACKDRVAIQSRTLLCAYKQYNNNHHYYYSRNRPTWAQGTTRRWFLYGEEDMTSRKQGRKTAGNNRKVQEQKKGARDRHFERRALLVLTNTLLYSLTSGVLALQEVLVRIPIGTPTILTEVICGPPHPPPHPGKCRDSILTGHDRFLPNSFPFHQSFYPI